MCLSSKKPAPAPTPAPAPPPPADAPVAPIINEESANAKNTVAANRNGRNSLRIDLNDSGPSGGSGLNIPT